jgi:uncharacterized SAM-binding protein YcdF (DUF218 family)
MMFIFSKLLSAITQPMFGLAVVMLAAFIGMGRWPRLARSLLGLSLVVLALLGFEAVPNALLRPLEMRYATPSADTVASQVGVIVLGGSFKSAESMVAHGQVPLGEAAERLTQAAALLHQHPEWALVFLGGEGRLLPTGLTEAQMARQFFLEQGIAEDRIQLESRSRTTRENAQQVAQLLGPRCQQPWLLITSAWHMPRAMEEFQKTGCRITPYPADYRTGNYTPWTEYSLAHSLVLWQVALHEWLGILAYRTTL